MSHSTLLLVSVLATSATVSVLGCWDPPVPTTDQVVTQKQEQSLAQAAAEVGMPAISNFTEMRNAKDIYERRDKAIATHAYIVNELNGCLVYLGPAIGYGLPYATQYSSPTKMGKTVLPNGTWNWQSLPQAEPNGLFMPSSAEGTWVWLKNPNGDNVEPIYVEPRVVVSPFRLSADVECAPRGQQAAKH